MPDIATYALSQAVQAHQLSESRHLKGKLVFKVK
ncbi:MAG: NADPH:quinone reductase-like Zn-dependent oxidoreductase [Gammaproteobacteria bacterium]